MNEIEQKWNEQTLLQKGESNAFHLFLVHTITLALSLYLPLYPLLIAWSFSLSDV